MSTLVKNIKRSNITSPLKSFIIPMYNAEKTISKTIDSIINQRIEDIEIILVDDGTINSENIACDNISVFDNRIIILHKTNGGLSDARNRGLLIANGKYIMFVDADDELNDKMERIDGLLQLDCDIILATAIINDIHTGKKKETHSTFDNTIFNKDDIKKYLIENRYKLKKKIVFGDMLQSCLYKKEFIFNNKLFFEKKQTFGEDARFMMDAYCNANSIYIINLPTYIYNYDSKTVSNKYADRYMDSTLECYGYLYNYYLKFDLNDDCFFGLIGITWVGIKSSLLICNNRGGTYINKFRKFVRSKEIRRCLLMVIKMNRIQLSIADLSRRNKIAAILILLGLYKEAYKYA